MASPRERAVRLGKLDLITAFVDELASAEDADTRRDGILEQRAARSQPAAEQARSAPVDLELAAVVARRNARDLTMEMIVCNGMGSGERL